jgi:hypothetical protein
MGVCPVYVRHGRQDAAGLVTTVAELVDDLRTPVRAGRGDRPLAFWNELGTEYVPVVAMRLVQTAPLGPGRCVVVLETEEE